MEPSSEINVDNLPEEEKLKIGRSSKLNHIQTMVIKLGTGGDNQDHVSTPVSKRSRRFSVLSDSRNHMEGTFEYPDRNFELKVGDPESKENIVNSQNSAIFQNQHIVVPVGSMKRPLSNYSAHTRTYASQ